MEYLKNKNLEYIPCGKDSLIVLDPDSGDVFLFNETGAQVIYLLDESRTFEELIGILMSKYQGERKIIQSEINDFIQTLLSNRIVVSI